MCGCDVYFVLLTAAGLTCLTSVKSKIGFSEVGLGLGLGMRFAIYQPTSGHLWQVCAQIMTATVVTISALWFYVHRVHMLPLLKNQFFSFCTSPRSKRSKLAELWLFRVGHATWLPKQHCEFAML